MVTNLEEDTIAAQMLKVLVTRTINDISYETMGKIVRRLQGMSIGERGSEKRVASVLSEELGSERALNYIEKALASGAITRRQYDTLRAHIILPLPRKEIPLPWAGRAAQELLEAQKRLRREFQTIGQAGQEALRAPMSALDKDVERIRKAWGL